MKVYKQPLFENTCLMDQASSLHKAGFMAEAQVKAIEKHLPAYHSQNHVMARLALFILGILLYAACSSLFTFIFAIGNSQNYAPSFFVNSLFGFLVLEFYLIGKLKYYRQGIDDAFLVCAQICLIVFLSISAFDDERISVVFLFTFLIGLVCSLRYIDRFSAIVACIGLTALVIDLAYHASETFKGWLPFLLLLYATALYFLQAYLRKKDRLFEYHKPLNCVSIFAYLIFYLSANYFVVRESGIMRTDLYLSYDEDIPMAWFFYGFTFLCPLLYLFFSIRNKNRSLFWIAILALAFSIFSIRYYYALIPLQWALIGGGGLVFGLAYFSMWKLRGKTSGLTFEPDRYATEQSLLNMEVLTLIQKFSVTPVPQEQHPSGAEGRGGSSGGAGSGGDF